MFGYKFRCLAQSSYLRVPETIFTDSFDYRVDLWRAGCMVRQNVLLWSKHTKQGINCRFIFFIHVISRASLLPSRSQVLPYRPAGSDPVPSLGLFPVYNRCVWFHMHLFLTLSCSQLLPYQPAGFDPVSSLGLSLSTIYSYTLQNTGRGWKQQTRFYYSWPIVDINIASAFAF